MANLNIVYATFGSGSGDLMFAASLAAAFRRAGVANTFTALSNSEFHYLFSDYFDHIRVRPQPRYLFRRDRETDLYSAITMLEPDLLIVSMIWLPLLPILHELPGRKVFLARISPGRWWAPPAPEGAPRIAFDPSSYDDVFVIEPNAALPWGEETEPLVVCNRDELSSRKEARRVLGVQEGKKALVIAQNGYAGELDELLDGTETDPGEYQVIPLQNSETGRNVFPLARYLRGVDLLVGGGGYNLFYESRFFEVPARITPFPRNGDDQFRRVEMNADYRFNVNGADRIVRRVAKKV